MADIEVQNEGSIVLIRPLSLNGQTWIEEHLSKGDWNPDFPRQVILDHRYFGDIFAGMLRDDLEVEMAFPNVRWQ